MSVGFLWCRGLEQTAPGLLCFICGSSLCTPLCSIVADPNRVRVVETRD
jgi:hypothetical protein